MDIPHRYKILFVGDTSVGKTSIVHKYVDNNLPSTNMNTIGVDFVSKLSFIENKQIKFLIWDTAGQERYRAITRAYYRGAQGVFIVFDLNSIESRNSVPSWIKDVESDTTNVPKMLVGNKLDIFKGSLVETESFAKELGLPFVAVSAVDGTNIEELFNKMGKKLLEKNVNVEKEKFRFGRRNNCC